MTPAAFGVLAQSFATCDGLRGTAPPNTPLHEATNSPAARLVWIERGTWVTCALGQRKLLMACESLGCVNVGLVLYIHGG